MISNNITVNNPHLENYFFIDLYLSQNNTSIKISSFIVIILKRIITELFLILKANTEVHFRLLHQIKFKINKKTTTFSSGFFFTFKS